MRRLALLVLLLALAGVAVANQGKPATSSAVMGKVLTPMVNPLPKPLFGSSLTDGKLGA